MPSNDFVHQIEKGGIWLGNKTRVFDGAGGPTSGTSGTGATRTSDSRRTPLGSIYIDKTNGTYYFNEGTSASPYWTPVSFNQHRLLGWYTDFRDGKGIAVADTGASTTLAGSGLRIFGTGIEETDSGFTVAYTEGGAVGSLIVSATANKVAALGFGDANNVCFQPDTHGPLVVDALIAQSSAITLRACFCGFVGTYADALAEPVTGATTTLTLVQDDVAGLFFDVGLTATDRWYAPHNKSDEAASIATTATGVDTSTTVAAAGTYQRLRVEITRAGIMRCFIDKTQVTSIAASLDVDEEVAPVLLISSTSSATKTMLVKQFAAWGVRPSGA